MKIPDAPEGQMSKCKARCFWPCFSPNFCIMDLGNYPSNGKRRARMGGRNKETILADAFEAILGAFT
jgi:ribonuclease-3